jgi:hypothetical protein
MQSQMEAKFTSMNLQVVRTQVQHASSPSAPHLQHQHEPPVASIRLELLLPSPDSANSVGNPSDAAATLAQQARQIQTQQRRASYIRTGSRLKRSRTGTWAGVGSLGQVAERDNSPTQDISVEPRSSRHRAPTWASPATQLSALLRPMAVLSRTLLCHGRQLGEHGEYVTPAHVPESSRRTMTPRVTVRQLTSLPPN